MSWTAFPANGCRDVEGSSSPEPSSAAARQSSGKAWSPAMGVSRPQATGIAGASSRSSRRRTTSTPPSQWASPVPETVMALISTPGDARRKAIATRSSGATSVSISKGSRSAAASDAAEVDAGALGPHPPTTNTPSRTTMRRVRRAIMRTGPSGGRLERPEIGRTRYGAPSNGSVLEAARRFDLASGGQPDRGRPAHQSSLPFRARDRAGAPAPRTPRDGSSRYRWCSCRSL